MRGDSSVLREVAELHARCISTGFLSGLGPTVLEVLYRSIAQSRDNVLITESRNGRVVGFVCGGQSKGQIVWGMLRNWTALLNGIAAGGVGPRKLAGIIETLIVPYKGGECGALPEAELYSLAVAPEFRGRMVADEMYRRLCEYFRSRGIRAFRIVVGGELWRAQRFYERMGARRCCSIAVHRGAMSTVYVQELGKGKSGCREPVSSGVGPGGSKEERKG